MVTQTVLDAFDHLIELLEEEGIDPVVITLVEDAKDALDEYHGED